MKSPLLAELLRPAETVRRIIWWAFFAAIFGYAVVLYRTTVNASARPMPGQFIYAVAVLSAGDAVLSFFISGLLLPQSRLRQLLAKDPDLEVLARTPGGTPDQNRLSKIKMLSPQDRCLLSIVPAFFSVYIVRLALCESIALFGLVLGKISHSFVAILPFAAAALALMLTVSPGLDSSLERANALFRRPADAPGGADAPLPPRA